MCDKHDRAITYMFCQDLHLTLMFYGLLQKDLFKLKWSLVKRYFKQNYCHAYLSHKVCCLLPSPVLVRKFTITGISHWRGEEKSSLNSIFNWLEFPMFQSDSLFYRVCENVQPGKQGPLHYFQ